VDAFEREVCGRVLMNAPKLNWEVHGTPKEANGDVPIITKPVKREFGWSPEFLSVSGPALSGDECVTPGTHMAVTGSRQMWGYAIYVPTSVQADKAEGLTQGVIGW